MTAGVHRRISRRFRSDRGGISPFILVLLPALVGLAGLAYDGGNLFTGRREANTVAAAAARAGANDLLEASIYAGSPELAPSAASTATGFAFAQGASAASARRVDVDLIEVNVSWTVDMEFLGIFGVGAQTVSGSAQARALQGITG